MMRTKVRGARKGHRPFSVSRRAGDTGDGGLALLDQQGEIVQIASPAVTASLRSMIARSRLADGGYFPDVLGVTSTFTGEGVTFICRALALVLANDTGKRVCIVDLNWWEPTDWPHPRQIGGGVADLIRGSQPVETFVLPTGTPNVSILPAGEAPLAERPVLAGSDKLGTILTTLSATYDHVLLDLPAVRATSELLLLAEHPALLALVVRQGASPEGQVIKALEELSAMPSLGVILNWASTEVPGVLKRLISDS
jgi:Mrp family chromosome partitioning ATPase